MSNQLGGEKDGEAWWNLVGKLPIPEDLALISLRNLEQTLL